MVGIYRDTEHDLEAAEEQISELQYKLGEKWDKIAELEIEIAKLEGVKILKCNYVKRIAELEEVKTRLLEINGEISATAHKRIAELEKENKRLLDDNRKLHQVQDDLQEIKRKLQEKVLELEAELQRRSFATGNVQLDQIKSLEMKISELSDYPEGGGLVVIYDSVKSNPIITAPKPERDCEDEK